MPLDFRKTPNPTDGPPRRRRPPDYLSRPVQRRLLLLVSLLMLIVIMASKVSDPRFWNFMGFERPIAGGTPLTSQEVVSEDVDTRLRQAAAADSSPSETPAPMPAQFDDSRLGAALWDGWQTVLSALEGDEQLLLYQAFDQAAAGQPLARESRGEWDEFRAELDEQWTAYLRDARTSLRELSETERTKWSELLEQLSDRWQNHDRPALQRLGEEQPEGAELQQLAHVQAALDVATKYAIRDDMVARPQEKAAWFRWLTRVRDCAPEELLRQSRGPTGFLPLYKQSAEFRGEVVTVRGVVHLAYHVDAPPNRTGIPGYYLFWLHPAGGPNSPIVVYSLETPRGFPAIRDKQRDGGVTKLYEEVEFTGYFFKRWAYESQGGIHVAPVVLARAPRWQPSASELDNGPTPATIIGLIAGTAIAGIALAWYMFRRAGDGGPTAIGNRPTA